jgi:hypothetical protein
MTILRDLLRLAHGGADLGGWPFLPNELPLGELGSFLRFGAIRKVYFVSQLWRRAYHSVHCVASITVGAASSES